jgi:hypothetical protein
MRWTGKDSLEPATGTAATFGGKTYCIDHLLDEFFIMPPGIKMRARHFSSRGKSQYA